MFADRRTDKKPYMEINKQKMLKKTTKNKTKDKYKTDGSTSLKQHMPII